MSEIGLIEGKFNRIKTSYNMNIEGKCASEYYSSLIYSRDNNCIKAIDDVINASEDFTTQITGINTKSKYNDADNTYDYLMKMKSNVQSGITQFSNYKVRILKASQDVFDEYKRKFNATENLYKDGVKTIEGLIKKANKADSLYKTYSGYAKSSLNSTTDWGAAANRKKKERDNYIKAATGYISSLEGFVNKLKEILDKGLRIG